MLSAPDLLKEARHAAGLTQVELADRLGVSQSEIARLEKHGANPRLDTLVRAIAATGHELTAEVGPSPGIDETTIAADLRLAPDERLRAFESFYGFLRDAGGAAVRPDGS
jgi:transcriptional regulator with XRE-family HTH domain